MTRPRELPPKGKTIIGRLFWRANVWLDLHPLLAYTVLIAVLVVGTYRIETVADDTARSLQASEKERTARVKTGTIIVFSTCHDNNQQDRLLARLVAVSLGGNSTFGKGLDPSILTVFDKRVLGTIVKVQQATTSAEADEGKADLQTIFKEKLADLRDLRDCRGLAHSYREGKAPPPRSLPR